VVRLGSNDPISEVDVELTRLEGTAAYPLAPPAFPRGNFSPGAVVAPTSPNPADMPSTRTNQDGRFVFRNLKPGTYRLLAARGGGEYYPVEYGQHGPKGHGHNFQLAESQTMKDIRLEMAATGAISGRVFDADGAPVGRVQVMALEASYQSGQRTLKIVQARDTDDRGAYRLFWLPPGRYYIAARPEDPRSRFVTLVSGPPGFFGEESYAQPLAILRSLSSAKSSKRHTTLRTPTVRRIRRRRNQSISTRARISATSTYSSLRDASGRGTCAAW